MLSNVVQPLELASVVPRRRRPGERDKRKNTTERQYSLLATPVNLNDPFYTVL